MQYTIQRAQRVTSYLYLLRRDIRSTHRIPHNLRTSTSNWQFYLQIDTDTAKQTLLPADRHWCLWLSGGGAEAIFQLFKLNSLRAKDLSLNSVGILSPPITTSWSSANLKSMGFGNHLMQFLVLLSYISLISIHFYYPSKFYIPSSNLPNSYPPSFDPPSSVSYMIFPLPIHLLPLLMVFIDILYYIIVKNNLERISGQKLRSKCWLTE